MQQNVSSVISQEKQMSLFIQAILWFVLSTAISSGNDVLMRFLGERLDSFQVVWFRFLFGTVSLLPFMFFYGLKSFRTSRPFVHFIRGLFLFLGVAGWCIGLTTEGVHLTLATTISFTVPIFVLILAIIFLKEKVSWQRWAATLIGLIGIIISLEPTGVDFNFSALILLGSVILFASLDIINKFLIVQESTLAMLFYSALVTTIIGFVPALLVWKTPTFFELALLFLLGAGGNLILYCILKAFALAQVSALAPFRYGELIFASLFGYLVFAETPKTSTLLGCAIIIPATLYLAYAESRKKT